MKVMITGAGGNLGGKLAAHLHASDWCTGIVGVDVRPIATAGKFRAVVADLRDPSDRRWTDLVPEVNAIVHFAAQNAAPDSNWLEATQSFDMTLNLLEQAGRGECRFIFASSNHAMGGYKDAPLPPDGKISGATPPIAGTRMFDGYEHKIPGAYGSTKLLGERAVIARAAGTGGRLSGVNIRIGWVQPGDNRPDTIGPHGGGSRKGPDMPDAEDAARSLKWFRNMWLSNRDFLQLLEKAIRSPASSWSAPAITVSGMSNNSGMAWDLTAGQEFLGYQPVDDAWAELGRSS
jgi:nucleoside-diphosphate-sugar epimerase